MKTFEIKYWSDETRCWESAATKCTLGEAISSVRYQHERSPEREFEITEVTKILVFEFPCAHDELDHGICMSCGEDRNMNSNRFGKTPHEQ